MPAWSADTYTVQALESITRTANKDDWSALRAEYTRLRDVAQKRVKRLGQEFPQTKAYQMHEEGFAKLKDLDPRDFPKAMSELYKFVNAKGSTVAGQRSIKEKTIQTWRDQGLDLNSSNYDTAIKVLEEMRRKKIVYGSDKVVALANVMEKLSKRQQRTWLNNIEKLISKTDKLEEIPNVRGMSFASVLSAIGNETGS